MSLRAIWRRIWHPTGFVGRDLEGNSYYERLNPLKGIWLRGSRRLPIQWSAWLAHTRAHPPSIQELQTDLIRQQRVQRNAALIEASYQQERAQLRIQESTDAERTRPSGIQESTSSSPDVQDSSTLHCSLSAASDAATTPTPENIAPTQKKPETSLPKTGSDDYQPESWTPQLRIRRG
ncbi:hypothetical protein BT96DRAFT_1013826 [Gymnopus androsaceus JB14]|uniref:NADH dehydrogenase [ubiquinone] 1 alpha subcomplex subunit n=1 Tax=Gymnopus androsaceus JB14 TaxID=1447944 RepID=A0A6A4IBJ8_9AGAR|nr:hypothetical protein BT96DRAFT_1013826 [Gymnopus androsaceus JB14]